MDKERTELVEQLNRARERWNRAEEAEPYDEDEANLFYERFVQAQAKLERFDDGTAE